MRQLPLGLRLPDRAVFASFVPGPNTEALRHAQQLAAGAGATLSWFCGPPGAGKTHLLQAICAGGHEAARRSYLPLREAAALGPGVLEGLSSLDCLCLDDVEAVSGDGAWERGLFALLRECEENGARLVLAAAEAPGRLTWALPDLRSRCAAGAVLTLRLLDEPGQQLALRRRAELRGLELPEETVHWLQRRFPRDMRTLYELLDTLDVAGLAAQRRLTVPFIREVLGASARRTQLHGEHGDASP
ncbi:MAG: DnaA regulatory inactivator Hda [Gammaproteobacteria bacterium]|nr:DnaA regulatory inactivator Hda [Gammaproteobacteria bacterium]MBV9619404.1 DnaA regulatory inactivator Hda [Gammaproteobacteria bacterium]